jgi:signal peptidase I
MTDQSRVEIRSRGGRARFTAIQGTSNTLLLSGIEPGTESITLRLSRLASFDPAVPLLEKSFPVENGQAEVTLYSPARPGYCMLTGPGVRTRVDFAAASHLQGLLYEWVPTIAVSVLIAWVLRTFVVASFYIPSKSMERTLLEGDLLIADKLSYRLLHHDPARGDVMIFQFPDNRKQDYIKRVIGLPGDTVEVVNGRVRVNGVELDESYTAEESWTDFDAVTVPEGHYFMMGDNRNHSSDSRVWGFVPADHLEGRALFIFFPFSRARSIPNGLMAQSERIPPGSAYAAEPEHSGEAAADSAEE